MGFGFGEGLAMGERGATPALAGGAREAACSVRGSPTGWLLRDEFQSADSKMKNGLGPVLIRPCQRGRFYSFGNASYRKQGYNSDIERYTMNKTLNQLSTNEFETLVERAVDKRLEVWMTQLMDALTSIDEPSSELRPEFAESLRKAIKQSQVGEGMDLKSFRHEIEG
jgi:hypothetical protein